MQICAVCVDTAQTKLCVFFNKNSKYMHVIKEKQLQLTTDNHHPITLVIILNIPRFLMTLWYYKQQKQ